MYNALIRFEDRQGRDFEMTTYTGTGKSFTKDLNVIAGLICNDNSLAQKALQCGERVRGTICTKKS